jgi:hypothetical protein
MKNHALTLAFVFTWLSIFALSSPALALNQPDGSPIPSAASSLPMLFAGRGEMIDAARDAATMPERFVPGCRLTFTLVTRGPAMFRNSFGWYNVTGRAPTEAELHALIPCDSPQGFVANLDLSREPAYAGGEIGFFLRTPEDGDTGRCLANDCCASPMRAGGRTYFSERRFNPDSVAAGGSGYVHMITYDSRATRDAFYFAWEDLFRGGDNNFTDFVALVSNIVCSGAGGACDTGMRGACAQGTLQCRAGSLVCVPSVRAGPERCDGLDNDCNGMDDDGMGLCTGAEVCDRGVCVPPCVERACFAGFRCSDRGTCVEDACVNVMCMSGQRCVGGRCVGACEGIRCPADQQCRAGRCVNPCEGVMCDADQVCVAGTCIPRCQCRRCNATETCQADGRCVSRDCAAVMCAAGQRCVMGVCQDVCVGVQCPNDQRCQRGQCVAIGSSATDGGSGVDAANLADATSPAVDGAGPQGMDGAVVRDSGVIDITRRNLGCACRSAAHTSRDQQPFCAVISALVLACCPRRRKKCKRGNHKSICVVRA